MVLRRSVLSRGFVRRLCILYVPKGPVLDPIDDGLRARLNKEVAALISDFMGAERFGYEWMDNRDEILTLYAAFREVNRKDYPIVKQDESWVRENLGIESGQ